MKFVPLFNFTPQISVIKTNSALYPPHNWKSTVYVLLLHLYKTLTQMNYSENQHELNALFQLGKDTHIEKSNIDIRFFNFKSQPFSLNGLKKKLAPPDTQIAENLSFVYPVFLPSGMKKAENAIFLLHGLNERYWNKYLCWAEYLCKTTGKPVVLFPIAFHMNRSPLKWTDPQALKPILDTRRKQNGEDRMLSFANVIFSERICENPLRFYGSGRQSLSDLAELASNIKLGNHPLFKENAHIDIFSYSIGAFLSQITLMTNPSNLFADSKLFMFCGGGIFSSMFGESRCIMDKLAFNKLFDYYLNNFSNEAKSTSLLDKGFESFYSMISPEKSKKERESFFSKLGNRILGISLTNDTVIPYKGVVEALGNECAKSHIKLLDFPFNYTHENPFPIYKDGNSALVDTSFNQVFSVAANFLS